LGLQGDPNSSIAIIDTGIDSSHVDFSPGYGNQNFSKKIVGWNDQVNFTSSPFDDNGHGTHVAGLAAGTGFFSNASGYATSTWGMDLTGTLSGYTYTGMMVNNSGIITLSAKWTSNGTAKMNTLSLFNSGKSLSSWSIMNSVSTPANNTWYTLSFNVASIPNGGYDMYDPRVDVTAGTGNLFVVVNMSWPYIPPSDNFSAWTGIAPQSKLVGVKVANSQGTVTSTQIINGINWVISNKIKYHTTVASISLAFPSEISSLDSAVLSLVNSGISTVVAAGNDGSGGNYINSPACVDEAITVAAMNQFDNIASYSSQGGLSKYTNKTSKPDITAPGGSGKFGSPLFSADSNTNDADGGMADVQLNDAAPMQGTSMAAPIIAGCSQLIIQAMGGYANWNWSRSQALQPKMLLLMTATETYPNSRESGASPTLNRGGKDIQEGYGRVNLDGAVDAVSKSYTIGSVAADTLGLPPNLSNIAVVGQKLVWARNVQLTQGARYNFSLNVPFGSDYDLYLYNSTGTIYGEPAIKAQSTNETTGGTEQFWVTPTYTGTFYIVVKRATETTGNGAFVLSSSSITTSNVTLLTPGIANATNVVHYIQNGVTKNGSIVAGNFSGTADIGTTLTIDNPINVSATQKYVTTDASTFKVQLNPLIEDLTIQSPHPYPNNYNTTWTINRSNATRMRVHFTYIHTDANNDYVYFLNETYALAWSGTYDGLWSNWLSGSGTFKIRLTSDSSTNGDGFIIDQIEYETPNVANYTTNFKTDYYLNVSSPYGITAGSGWYDSGTFVNASLNNGTISGGSGVQYVFTNWSGDTSGSNLTSTSIIMNATKTAIANWKTQYYLNATSTYGSTSGSGWYDSAALANAILSNGTVSGGIGVQYVFTGWGGDASGTDLTSNSIAMTNAKNATTSWKTQYQVNFTISPTGSGSTNPSGSNIWSDSGSTLITSALNAGYTFSSWSSNTGSITFSNKNSASTTATINGPGTITASFVISTYAITVTQGVNGVISPGTTTVNYGDSQTFTITPNTGSYVASLIVDGSSVTIAPSYTFSNIQAPHTITATFALIPTSTPSPTPSPSPSPTPSPTGTIPSTSPTPSPTPTPSLKLSPSPSPTPSIPELSLIMTLALLIGITTFCAVILKNKKHINH
jgi:subtilisin family serine protease